MKTTLTYIAIFTLLISGYTAEAEDGTSTRPRPVMQGRMEIRDARKEGREDIREIRQEGRGEIRDMRDEDRTASTSANERFDEMKKIRADMKVKVDARKVDLKTEVETLKAANKTAITKRLDEKAKGRVQTLVNTVYGRLITRINALTKVDGEVTRRITNLSNATTTVAISADALVSVKALQVTAQDLLAKAKVDVEATKATTITEINATTTKEVIKALVTKSENSIKAAAEGYKKVSEALKAAHIKK
jgi:hypothetical protein